MDLNVYQDTLVTGRAGELADYASPQAFALIEKILGFAGPYRKVLHQFGIGDLRSKKSFISYIDGRIHTDVSTETVVLWRPCSFKLSVANGKVENKFHFYGFKELLGFFKKLWIEIKVLAFVENYVMEAEKKYEHFSQAVEEAFHKKYISESDFLVLYEDVVFVSYLYELFFNYNNGKGFVDKPGVLKDFVRASDYMLQESRSFVEFVCRFDKSFGLGQDIDLEEKLQESKGLPFIPSKLAPLDLVATPVAVKKELVAESKLQCMKNNMRLKTEVLLVLLK